MNGFLTIWWRDGAKETRTMMWCSIWSWPIQPWPWQQFFNMLSSAFKCLLILKNDPKRQFSIDNFKQLNLALVYVECSDHSQVITVHHCTKCWFWYVKIINKTVWSSILYSLWCKHTDNDVMATKYGYSRSAFKCCWF